MTRSHIRIPLWAALAIPGAAYVVRSLILRDGDFTPDMPTDLIAIGVFAVAMSAVAWARRGYSEPPSSVDQHGENPPAGDA